MAIVSRTTSFLVTLVVAFFVFAPVGAKTPRPVAADTAATDSSRFVTASLLVITPGPDIYSVLGHTALRMQCPSKGLDYCFSFETETGLAGYLSFFAGQSHAGFMPVPTATFLAGYRQQGRGVTQYDLNLTPHEKQELWRALDNDMLEGAHRKFNLIQNNCTSMALLKIESILDDEGIDFRRMPAPMYYKNGRGVEYLSRRSPWAQFLFMTFLGSEADTDWPLENKMNPELIIPVLRNAIIRPADAAMAQRGGDAAVEAVPQRRQEGAPTVAARPVLSGVVVPLVPLRNAYDEASPLTPGRVFGALLLLTAVYALWSVRTYRKAKAAGSQPKASCQWLTAWRVVAAVYGLLSLFLLYVTLVSGLFGVHWNWLLIPFSIVPFLVWLFFRKREGYVKVYVFYAAALALFIAIVPWLTTQLMPAHYLIAGILLLLCAAHYLRLSVVSK